MIVLLQLWRCFPGACEVPAIACSVGRVSAAVSVGSACCWLGCCVKRGVRFVTRPTGMLVGFMGIVARRVVQESRHFKPQGSTFRQQIQEVIMPPPQLLL